MSPHVSYGGRQFHRPQGSALVTLCFWTSNTRGERWSDIQQHCIKICDYKIDGFCGRKFWLCSWELKRTLKRNKGSLLIGFQAHATNFRSGVLRDKLTVPQFYWGLSKFPKKRDLPHHSKVYTIRPADVWELGSHVLLAFSRNKRFGLVEFRCRTLEGYISGHSMLKIFSSTYEPIWNLPTAHVGHRNTS